MVDVANDAASSDDVASVLINSTVGQIESQQVNPSFGIYPNPSKGSFTLKSDNLKEDVQLTISDISGKILYSAPYTQEKVSKGVILDSNFAEGFYIIELVGKKTHLFEKLIINN